MKFKVSEVKWFIVTPESRGPLKVVCQSGAKVIRIKKVKQSCLLDGLKT